MNNDRTKHKPTPKQDKHRDPFFRAKFLKYRAKSVLETYEHYMKSLGNKLPKHHKPIKD